MFALLWSVGLERDREMQCPLQKWERKNNQPNSEFQTTKLQSQTSKKWKELLPPLFAVSLTNPFQGAVLKELMHEFGCLCDQRWTNIPVWRIWHSSLQSFSSQLEVFSLKVTNWKGLIQNPKLGFSVGWWDKDWKDLQGQKYEMKVFCMSEEGGSRKQDKGRTREALS